MSRIDLIVAQGDDAERKLDAYARLLDEIYNPGAEGALKAPRKPAGSEGLVELDSPELD